MTIKEECHVCGGEARLTSEPVEVRLGRRAVIVEAERMLCESCGSEFYLPGQMEAALQEAALQVRAANNLLSELDILAIRKGYGLTQAGLERLLAVGPKTVVRWERGTVLQSGATDSLLRVIGNVPAAAEYLASLHGVQLTLSTNQPTMPDPILVDQSNAVELDSEMDSPAVYERNDILHLDDYRRRKADMQPVPPDLLREAQL